MNTAKKGRKYEWKIRDEYIKKGYTVVRAAGSRGKIDLVAINPQTRIILLTQCKTTKLSKKQKETILAPLKALEGRYTVIAELK